MIMGTGWSRRPRRDIPAASPQNLTEVGEAYTSSYLRLRLLIGALAVLLPAMLIVGDTLLLPGSPAARGSLSAYYYSGMRDEFVGVLVATGAFLVTYKVAEWRIDNFLSSTAGLTLVVAAVVPTWRPHEAHLPPTLLQNLLGEDTAGYTHAAAAGIAFASLAGMSFVFGLREGRGPRCGRLSPQIWRAYHWVCSAVVTIAIVAVAFAFFAQVGGSVTLWLETVALGAFGASWFAKGFQLDRLHWHRLVLPGTMSRMR